MNIMKIARPHFDGLARREFLLPYCKSCKRAHFYPRSACPHCWGEDYDWRQASGKGRVHSFTIVRSNPPSAFKALLPYTIAIIDLQEGVRTMANITGDPNAVQIGDEVQLEFMEREGTLTPAFRRVP